MTQNINTLKDKMDNIEDPELKQIIEDINSVMIPKFQEIQEKLVDGNLGLFKMMKLGKQLMKDIKEEYQEKFGRDFEEDSKKMNDYIGLNQLDLLNTFSNLM